MKVCSQCGGSFPTYVVVAGIKHILSSRKTCLDCLPFKSAESRSRKPSSGRFKLVPVVCAWRCCRKPFNTHIYVKSRSGTCYCSLPCRNKDSIDKLRTRRKAKYVAYKGGKCQRCGYSKCLAALEFHHRDPNKKEFSITRAVSYTWSKAKRELDKCDLLCSNCHRELHSRDFKGIAGMADVVKVLA